MAPSSSPPCLGSEEDCRKIHATLNCLSHLGKTLARLTPSSKRKIRENYRCIYGKDLTEHLHNAQQSNPDIELCNILYLWMLEPHERDAVVAEAALENIDADYKALIEIYTSRKSNQIFQTSQAYLARFKRYLDQDIISQQPHSYQKILVALATSHRSHNVEVSQYMAKCDAKRLYAAKGINGAADEPAILELFSKRSIPQLKQTFSCYELIYGHSFTKALENKSSGEFEESLSVVIRCMVAPHKYYSKMLYNCMNGKTMSKRVLSRLMMHAAELGMEEIKEAFLKMYKINLQNAICKSVQEEDYKEFLVALTNNGSTPTS